MHHVSRSFRERIACYLLTLLSREESRWRVPAMAFLVEVILMASSASLSCLLTLCLLQLQLWGEPYQWRWGRAEALLCALGPLLLG